MARISTAYSRQPFKILDARNRVVGWTSAPCDDELLAEMRALGGCAYRYVRNRKTGDV